MIPPSPRTSGSSSTPLPSYPTSDGIQLQGCFSKVTQSNNKYIQYTSCLHKFFNNFVICGITLSFFYHKIYFCIFCVLHEHTTAVLLLMKYICMKTSLIQCELVSHCIQNVHRLKGEISVNCGNDTTAPKTISLAIFSDSLACKE